MLNILTETIHKGIKQKSMLDSFMPLIHVHVVVLYTNNALFVCCGKVWNSDDRFKANNSIVLYLIRFTTNDKTNIEQLFRLMTTLHVCHVNASKKD